MRASLARGAVLVGCPSSSGAALVGRAAYATARTQQGIIDWAFYDALRRKTDGGGPEQDGEQSKPSVTVRPLPQAVKAHIISKYGQEHAPAILNRIRDRHVWRERGGWQPVKRISAEKMAELRASYAREKVPMSQVAQQYGISVEAVRRILRSARRRPSKEQSIDEEEQEE